MGGIASSRSHLRVIASLFLQGWAGAALFSTLTNPSTLEIWRKSGRRMSGLAGSDGFSYLSDSPASRVQSPSQSLPFADRREPAGDDRPCRRPGYGDRGKDQAQLADPARSGPLASGPNRGWSTSGRELRAQQAMASGLSKKSWSDQGSLSGLNVVTSSFIVGSNFVEDA
jgi:hypothetical protein